jgi:hypothetical protein
LLHRESLGKSINVSVNRIGIGQECGSALFEGDLRPCLESGAGRLDCLVEILLSSDRDLGIGLRGGWVDTVPRKYLL